MATCFDRGAFHEVRDIFERDAWFRRRYNIRLEAAMLMARVSLKAGDLPAAEKHFDAAVAELNDYPAPLVAWRVHAGRARLKSKMGDAAGAEEASARASEIISFIAGNVKEDKLRDTFLSATYDRLKI